MTDLTAEAELSEADVIDYCRKRNFALVPRETLEYLVRGLQSVKTGKWINDKGLYRCSECNELWTHWWANVVPIERMNKMMKYCPNCGAKMDVEEGEA